MRCRTSQATYPGTDAGRVLPLEAAVPLFGLAPGGVYPATSVASRAVRSYRTLSPLPALARLGGLLSAALSVGSHPPGVTWHSALWSPDFPPYHRSDTATVQPTPERKGSDIEARRQALMAQGRGFVAGADLLTLNSSCSARLKRIAIGRQGCADTP